MLKTFVKYGIAIILGLGFALPACALREADIAGVQAEAETTVAAFHACRDKVNTASRILRKIAADHGQPGELDDPEVLGAIAKDLSEDELSLLQDEADAIATVPAELTAIGARLPELTGRVEECLRECPAAQRPALSDTYEALKAAAEELESLKVAADDLANEIAVLL